MSYRARRVESGADVRPYEWPVVGGVVRADERWTGGPEAVVARPAGPAAPAVDAPPAIDPAQHQARLAALEREAFAKGYEQGERAGAEAGAKRADAMLRRLAQTLEELGELRRVMIRQTERQMVQLALAIARRIVRREVAHDQELTLMMARVALERLGDSTSVTIRLHPDDYAATVGGEGAPWSGSHVAVVADGSLNKGGCMVESDFGFVDASVDAQFHEIARGLLAEEAQETAVAVNRGR